MFFKKNFLLALVIVALSGCKVGFNRHKVSESTPLQDNSTAAQSTQSTEPQDTSTSEVDVEPSDESSNTPSGTWSFTQDNLKIEYTFSENKNKYSRKEFIQNYDFVSGSEPIRTITEEGIFVMEGSMLLPPEASGIRFIPTNFTITLNTEVEVNNANEKSWYGYSDWELNVPKEIGDLTLARARFPVPGTPYFNIIKQEESRILFGNASHEFITNELERPIELDESRIFVR